jgi:hypothetical protein
MKNDLSQVKAGDVLCYMYDTGAFGYTAAFVKVLKVGKKKVKVAFEKRHGEHAVRWRYLSYFTQKLSPAEAAEVLAEHFEGV